MKKTKMLKKNYEYKKVLLKGKYYSGSCIEAFVIKNNVPKLNFLGIAIGVKIAKAVKRNHIKRLIREVYRKEESKMKTGYSIVFLWKKKVEIEKATYENVKKDINKILEKADIFEEKI